MKEVIKLRKPIEYTDEEQGNVRYEPKIVLLESKTGDKALWFPYWLSTNKTKGKMKWGQRPPMLEEQVFLQLVRDATKRGLFSSQFLKQLKEEMQTKLSL